jgi:hypothetical protein
MRKAGKHKIWRAITRRAEALRAYIDAAGVGRGSQGLGYSAIPHRVRAQRQHVVR